MPRVPGVIPSAVAGVPYHSAKRTRLEYSTVAKTGLIDPASKNYYHFNFPTQNNQKIKKPQKNLKKIIKKTTCPQLQKFMLESTLEVSIKHLLDGSEPQISGVIPSAAAGVPLIPTKRTRLEYSTVAKTGYIDPA
ncbi:hypothetical protein BB561_006760, partial [Smittium simulii]